MAEVRLTADEASALRAALATLVMKTRTGELGLVRGHFVSSGRIFRRPERDALDTAVRKLGLPGLAEYRG